MTQNVTERKSREPNKLFAKRVQEARVAIGLTNLELARRLSVTERTVLRWQAGEVPPYARLADLARELQKPASHFLEVLV